MEISNNDINKIQEILQINPSDSLDLLRNILTITHKSGLDDLFFDYLHVTCEKSIQKENALYESICDGNQFNIIHGYSKNGKTTFVKHFLYRFKNDNDNVKKIIPIYFDFERPNGNYFYEKVQSYFKSNYYNRKGCRSALYEELSKFTYKTGVFIESISDCPNERDQLSEYFNIYQKIIAFYDKNENLGEGELKTLFSELFIKKINEDNCGCFFISILFFELYKRRNDLNNNSKVVFIFDNIDDYLTHKDFSFLQHPQIQLSDILIRIGEINIISVNFSKIVLEQNVAVFNFKNSLSVIYVFRTPNFFVFVKLLESHRKNLSSTAERTLDDLLNDSQYIHFKSVSYTTNIFSRRLEFFEKLTDKFKMDRPAGYIFLKQLTNDPEQDSDEFEIKTRRVYNLWNGDKYEMWKSISNNWSQHKSRYFSTKEENNLNILQNSNLEIHTKRYLQKGITINFFLYLLSKHNSIKEVYTHSIAVLDECSVSGKKNLSRMIINFIINQTLTNGKPSVINDIKNKGVGLYELLDAINTFIERVNINKELYTKNEIKSYFKNCYNTKIDYFGLPFTIYKDQISIDSDKKYLSKYYEIDDEIDIFFSGNSSEEELNKIRVYNNNSSVYISSSLLTNFELVSFQINNNILPLVYQIEKIDKNDNNLSIERRYLFFDTIRKVCEYTEILINKMVGFYCEYLIDIYDPNDFVNNPLFSVHNNTKNTPNGDFQFRLMITRHVTYIEGFRRFILNEYISLKITEEELDSINRFLASIELKYFDLYLNNYDNINTKHAINNDHILFTTKTKLSELKAIAEEIINSKIINKSKINLPRLQS